MSYTLTPFLVDLDALRQAAGGGDASIVEAAMAGNPSRFRELRANEDEISLEEALRHLVMGGAPVEDSAHRYGSALEELCGVLGEELGVRMWSGLHWSTIEDFGVSDLFDHGPPIPLPRIDDFPTIGHLTAEQAAARASAFEAASPPEDEWESREMRSEFVGWLRQAASDGKAIVFFYR